MGTRQTVFVRGASGGIGRSLAEHFARQCDTVILADISEKCGDVALDLADRGLDAHAFELDVTSEESVRAFHPKAEQATGTYATSKAGVVAFSRQLAAEVGGDGITVNCIAPGVIRTTTRAHADNSSDQRYLARAPAVRLGEPSDVTNVATFLATQASSYVTGATIDVDGSYFMA